MATDCRALDAKNFCAETLAGLYGAAAEDGARRLGAVARTFEATFGRAPADLFSSPGRIEIVGNHTDHNAGKVLAAAVNVDTVAAVSPREDGVIEVKSENYPVMRIAAGDTAFREEELGTSVALIKGVAEYFTRAGKATGGFNACMDSLVPKGSGVSSSSSFELAVAEIFNVYYNDGNRALVKLLCPDLAHCYTLPQTEASAKTAVYADDKVEWSIDNENRATLRVDGKSCTYKAAGE